MLVIKADSSASPCALGRTTMVFTSYIPTNKEAEQVVMKYQVDTGHNDLECRVTGLDYNVEAGTCPIGGHMGAGGECWNCHVWSHTWNSEDSGWFLQAGLVSNHPRGKGGPSEWMVNSKDDLHDQFWRPDASFQGKSRLEPASQLCRTHTALQRSWLLYMCPRICTLAGSWRCPHLVSHHSSQELIMVSTFVARM